MTLTKGLVRLGWLRFGKAGSGTLRHGEVFMSKFIFLNVLANGAVDWTMSLTAQGQPPIGRYHAFIADSDCVVLEELSELSGVHLSRYASLIESGAIIVAHSAQYHAGHMRATMIPMGLDPADGRTSTICSMMALTGHVPKFNGRKGWPTFAEACAHYGIDRAGEESAEDNARCLMSVFANMQRLGIVPEPKIWKDRHG